MRLIRLVPWAFVVGLAAACGGSDSGGDGSEQGIPLEELPEKYAEALCDAYESCIGDVLAIFRPGEDCVKNATTQLTEELASLSELVDKGRVEYHASKTQACLDEIAAGGCNFLIERAPASCEKALVGTLAEGEDCELDEECEGEQYCKVAAACPGKCASLEQAGGLCSGSGDCVSGLTCGETGRCVAPAKAGEDCKQGEPDCTPGYICLGDDAANKTPGKCQPLGSTFDGKAGDDCSLAEQWCGGGLVCEIKAIATVSGECVAKVGTGDACRAAFPDQCPDDEYCVLDTATPLDLFDGTCTSKPEAGEPCGKALGGNPEICAPYARCDDGVCRALAHLGESCSQNATCYSDHCVGGACVASNSCE
jgi:hypothetical protein